MSSNRAPITMNENRYGHMIQERYVSRLRASAEQREARLAGLRTRADAQRYCQDAQRKVRRLFGPWPRKTALHARTTGRVEVRGGVIENVLFDSRPNHTVTANLYLPAGDGPVPAVLGACGHETIGKAAENYQRFCLGLMHQGYAVLIYDPVSQGERDQYLPPESGKALPRGVCQHMMAGNQQALLGEFFGSWRAWDGIRALDYLLKRPEVDSSHVGVTGNSGGGTVTTYLHALDDRFTMAAPSCFITTYLANLENELPADSEQCPPGVLAAGLDMGDFILARAPRPVMLLGQKRDFFDRRGLEQTYDQVRRVYKLLGQSRRVQLFIGGDSHGFSQPNREAMLGFFNAHAGVDGSGREPRTPPLKMNQLFAAPKGQVHRLPDQRFVHEFNADRADELAKRRGRVSPQKLPAHIRRVLHLPSRPPKPHYRVLPPWYGKKNDRFGVAWRFGLETEPGIQAILHSWESIAQRDAVRWRNAPPSSKQTTLVVPHLGSHDEMLREPLRQSGDPVLSIDVRGAGQSRPISTLDPDWRLSYGVEYFYGVHSLMLGESYLGGRVFDVLCALNLLAEQGTTSVHLIGRGLGSVTATFAACLHPLVKRVTLINAPLSYQDLARTREFEWPHSVLPYGVLRWFDLPDCYRALRRKRLQLIEPWDEHLRPIPTRGLQKRLQQLGITSTK